MKNPPSNLQSFLFCVTENNLSVDLVLVSSMKYVKSVDKLKGASPGDTECQGGSYLGRMRNFCNECENNWRILILYV